MSKLSTACYAIRYIKLTQETLRMIYVSYVRSISTYEVIC